MIIRRATERDIDAMHSVRLSVRENRLFDATRVQPQDYRAMLNEYGRGWVAEANGRIVGFAIADLSRSIVWALFVDPAFERQGIGRRLHAVMLKWLCSEGAERVWLSTDPGTRAERFYRSAGWQFTGNAANGEVRLEFATDRAFSNRSPAETRSSTE